MINITIDEIKSLLEKKELKPKYQEETQQIYLIFKFHEAEFPLFIKIYHEGELLQIVMFIPAELDKTHASDVARLLHYINKEMDLPGFCLDESSNMIFYRILLPAINKQVNPELFLSYINAAKLSCETFAPVIQSVNLGKARYKDIIKKGAKD